MVRKYKTKLGAKTLKKHDPQTIQNALRDIANASEWHAPIDKFDLCCIVKYYLD
ncbi:unnamed protein product [Acanthoscelides obtectus]|uniref:Uncharacterized protein n=1 Tax=Acanthoscelides obtectus TaxID=200917 RepID=A0A9P0QJS9_ACAOB|nr:unnamed protein product [Acanthoscelides obtectus]CAK1687026.1 hypothetical protein AOBTE_LOCUS36182 [Acanthoscelides obtectus]